VRAGAENSNPRRIGLPRFFWSGGANYPISLSQIFLASSKRFRQKTGETCSQTPPASQNTSQISKEEKKQMQLVNESGQKVYYWISSASSGDCGEIDVDGLADLPAYDNQTNVTVSFNTDQGAFIINCDTTGTGGQVEMALVVEAGG
jgi:hypothetical protein